MSGKYDFGGFSKESSTAITQTLMYHREQALEIATNKAARTILAFRKTRVLEKTFERTLRAINTRTGYTAISQFVPAGYFNPHKIYIIDDLDRTIIRMVGPQYVDSQPGEVIRHAGNNGSFILLDDGSDLGPQYWGAPQPSELELVELANAAVPLALEAIPILSDGSDC